MAESEVLVLFKGKDVNLSRVAGGIGGSFNKLQGVVKGAMLGGVGALAGLGVATVGLGAKLVGLGSDAEEMQGKFNVVFANTGGQVTDALEDFADLVGRSKFELMEMASVFGDTLKPMGFTEEAAADMSVTMSQLATDLGSFNNMSMTESMERLQGVLIGNHENALAFGVIINENTLKAELAAMGADGLTGSMLEQAKVQARINLLMRGTTDAQGDAERTSQSWANQMRRLKARLTDFGTEIGSKILPILTPFLSKIESAIGVFENFIKTIITAHDEGGILLDYFQELPLFLQPAAEFLANVAMTLGRVGDIIASAFGSGEPIIQNMANTIYFLAWEGFGVAEEKAVALYDGFLQLVDSAIQLKDQMMQFIEPIQQWIQQNIQLKDVMIALGIVLGTIVLSALISIATAILPIIAIGAALIGVVALLRTAWENNWGGIQEKTAAIVAFIVPAFQNLVSWLKVVIPAGIVVLKGFWENTLLPAIQTVGDWIQTVFMPLITDILVPWLQEKIPAAIQTLTDFWQNTLQPVLEGVWDLLTVRMMPIWESLKDLFEVGMSIALEALTGIWQNVLLPALEKVWEFLKNNVIPIFEKLKDSVVDPLSESFAGLGNMIQNVSNFLDGLTDRLETVELPDWMTPGSPTPWENGLVGVRNQLQGLTTSDLPQFNNELNNVGQKSVTNNRTINQNFTVNAGNVDVLSESKAGLRFATGGV